MRLGCGTASYSMSCPVFPEALQIREPLFQPLVPRRRRVVTPECSDSQLVQKLRKSPLESTPRKRGEEQPFEGGLGPEGGWDVGRSVFAPGRCFGLLGWAYPPLGLVGLSGAGPRLYGVVYEALYSWVITIGRGGGVQSSAICADAR